MLSLLVLVCLSSPLEALYRLQPRQAGSTLVYVGTYTGDGAGDSKGIYAFSLNDAQSTITPLGLAVETSNPSYVLVHPSKKYIYSVGEEDDGKINSFKIDSTQTGKLTPINQQSSRGSYPCYLSTNKAGQYIFVANYGNGTVAVLPINGNDGSLRGFSGFDQQTGSSIDPDRQTSSHAHSILLDREERFAVGADLGSDQIYSYRFLANNGSLIRTTITRAAKPGDGPRHLVFDVNQKYVYLINELTSSITVFNYFPTMSVVQKISTLPSDFTQPNTAAEILLHPISGKFLYASNRGHDSIGVFSVDGNTGQLSLIEHVNVQGRTPRNFNISPDGKHLIVVNQDSNNLVVFTIDQTSGKLTPSGSTAQVSKPTCVKFLIP